MKHEQLNQFLHEKLFGACWHEVEKFHCSKCGEMFHPYWEIHPNYCGNIADAFKVVDKMREKGFVFSLTQTRKQTLATFNNEKCMGYSKDVAEIPLSICQAAKAAIEDMEKENRSKLKEKETI